MDRAVDRIIGIALWPDAKLQQANAWFEGYADVIKGRTDMDMPFFAWTIWRAVTEEIKNRRESGDYAKFSRIVRTANERNGG